MACKHYLAECVCGGMGGTEIPTGKAVLQNAYEEQPIDTMRVVQAH